MNLIKFYGTRGTGSLISQKYMEFGGATSCVLIQTRTDNIMIDCGSGINNAIDDLKKMNELHLLITHTHLDHISGITTLLSEFKNKPLHIYGKTFNKFKVKDIINNVMSKALWPVDASSYKNVTFHEIDGDFNIGNNKIYTMDSNHPGGCTLFRIETPTEKIVTAFDFSHLNGFDMKLCDFAKGADTLIYDGTFTKEDLVGKEDWGHSTPEDGVRIAKAIGVKKLYITHFGKYDDEMLENWEKSLRKTDDFVYFARSGESQKDFKNMLKVGALLAREKDNDVLLTSIVESCMEITNADGGTLYILRDNMLEFKVLINKSKGTKEVRKDNPLNIPAIPIIGKNACAESAREKVLINVSDIYENEDYDFSGAKIYDELNNYKTKSIIVIPLIDEFNDVIGVLQLINAKDENGKIIKFKKEYEDVLMAIANQASISVVKDSYSKKIDDLLYGFVKVMSVEIDERTPYNANHTRNMASFAEKFLDYESKNNLPYAVDFLKKREIIMSVWLHDIGKVLTPTEVMNKDSRLGKLTEVVNNRFERRELLLKLALANKKISEQEYTKLESERAYQLEVISKINKVGYLDDNLKAELDEIASKKYLELNSESKPVLTDEEHYLLSIVKGTLSKEERLVIEEHVSLTQKFLSQLDFPKHYNKIPIYAGNHHEFLDGSGYPNHLTEKDLPWPARLITICDIFEALVAKDRPYKKSFSVEEAIEILNEMALKGQLDAKLINEFAKSKCWEN